MVAAVCTRSIVAPRARVLVVEDDRIIALDLEMSLEAMGYEVAGVAHSSEEALALADRERPDLVLMDIRLHGDEDGFETAARLRLPIVYVSGATDAATIERAYAQGARGYLAKPFLDSALEATLEDALA